MATAVLPSPSRVTRSDPFEWLHRLGPDQRRLAYEAGTLSIPALSLWSAHYPDEVPRVNGEFGWIALTLADID